MSGTPITAESDSSPCPVDWNADNRKDLLVGSGSGDILLYLNEGTDEQPVYSTGRILNSESGAVHADSSAAPFVLDWNADGQQDLIMGGGDGAVHVYYGIPGRPEAPLLTSPEIIELNGQPLVSGTQSVPFPLDLNQDGSFELIVGSGDGSILGVN